MSTEPKLPPVPEWCGASAREMLHAYGRQCFEAGRQQGMVQERALWELAASSQEIEAGPQWVSVQERMPKSGHEVLVAYRMDHYPEGKLRVNRAAWIAAKTSESGPDSDIGEYDEETDNYYDPEGWYEQVDHWDEYTAIGMCGATVTHWMALPKPPKD